MPVLITDPELGDELRASREASDGDKWNEVWDGVLVMPSLPNDEHQELQANLLCPLTEKLGFTKLGKVRAGVNITDRHPDWKSNYRGPDVVVYLPDNPAINYGTYWLGGPDFLCEILSPGDVASDKFEFYAKVNTREVMIVDRYPWALDLFRLHEGELIHAGRSDLLTPTILESHTIPFTFQLQPSESRPTILVTHTATGQTWVV